MAGSLPHFSPFNPDSDSAGTSQRWKKWSKRFENFLAAMDISDDTRKRALSLHYIGESTYDIFETLPDTGEPKDYDKPMEKLTAHFTPQQNVDYERYIFRQTKQRREETLDQYNTRLRQLAVTCDFTTVDAEIKSQIICGCSSARLRRRVLREPEMSLKKLLDTARSMELSETQASGIEAFTSNPVNFTRTQSTNNDHNSYRQQHDMVHPQGVQSGAKPTVCRNCGHQYPHDKGPDSCPAKGKQCRSCGKLNHFSRCCRSTPNHVPPIPPQRQDRHNWTVRRHLPDPKAVRQIHRPETPVLDSPDSSSDDEYVFSVKPSKHFSVNHLDCVKCLVNIGQVSTPMLIDSGASVNLIDEAAYHNIKRLRKTKPLQLRPTTVQIHAYGSNAPLTVLGQLNTHIESKSRITPAVVYVVQGTHGSLLSYHTATELGLLNVNATTACSDITQSNLEIQYPSVFSGIGKLRDHQVKLHIDKNVVPVTQPHRRIPFHLRKKLENELDRLEQQGIIEKVNGPTPWVSPIVVAPKPKNPDEMRMCI